jgi:hypothetical protein
MAKNKKWKRKNIFRYGELNPGLAGLMLCMRAADASHYTITDYVKRNVLQFKNECSGTRVHNILTTSFALAMTVVSK